MSSPNGSTRLTGATGPTPEEDADDLGRLLCEARESQGVSANELARRTDVTAGDILEFEAGRVIPARPPFAAYMRALGFTAA